VIVSFKGNDPVVSGEFSLVSHIGAMVPRFIYSPIEEVSYNLFSKLSAEG
jgi:oligosaccharide translocation protein RFT1